MNLSANGRAKIEGYEGYHDALPDGSCRAYQKMYNGKKDKWTIGFGCTEGVYEGLVWTREQADAAFAKELAKFEAAVTRLVTVDLNQNQYDALSSFCYNVGLGGVVNGETIPGFSNSTLLKKLNKGDYKGAADQFQYWNHVNGKPVSGLTERRASEKNLFQKPTAAHATPQMPQTVSKAREPLSEKAAATATAAVTVAAQTAISAVATAPTVPAAPVAHVASQLPTISDLDKIVTTGQHVRSLSDQAGDLGTWLWHSGFAPFALIVVLAGLAFIWTRAGTGSLKGATNDNSQ